MKKLLIENLSGISLLVKQSEPIITDEIVSELKKMKFVVYWNDEDCKNWIFDFKIGDVWFSATNINIGFSKIELEAFK